MCYFRRFFLEEVDNSTGNQELNTHKNVGINQESMCSGIEIE